MAKQNNKKPNGNAATDPDASVHHDPRERRANQIAQNAPPPGYRKQAQDVTGYWDPEGGPIHFVPRSIKIFDSNLEPAKAQVLIVGELVEKCPIKTKDDHGEMLEAEGEPGDVVGVWYKPGMRALVNLCDAKVWMYQSGERQTGKPNPMKLFSVASPGPNKKFAIVIDERNESAGISTDFCGSRAGGPARRRGGPDRGYTRDPDADMAGQADEDNIPF